MVKVAQNVLSCFEKSMSPTNLILPFSGLITNANGSYVFYEDIREEGKITRKVFVTFFKEIF